MAEYINKQDVMNMFYPRPTNIHFVKLLSALIREKIETIPAADVRPVVRGKWKLGGYGQISDATEKWYDQFLSGCFFYCSACKERSSTKTHFCPNCGADMREES